MITKNNLEGWKVTINPGFAVSLPTLPQVQGLPATVPHCIEGADFTVRLRMVFHLLIHNHTLCSYIAKKKTIESFTVHCKTSFPP